MQRESRSDPQDFGNEPRRCANAWQRQWQWHFRLRPSSSPSTPRALRCERFNFTNLHRYDDAIKQYRATLKLDPDDEKSRRELDYIRLVREGRVAKPIP